MRTRFTNTSSELFELHTFVFGLILIPFRLPTGKSYRKIHPEVSVQSHLVTHGHLCPSSDSTEPATYDSTAFFIRHDSSSLEFLFFGDVGPDALSTNPRILEVWKEAAPKIVNGTLSTIFIECSWPAGREDHLLFGHLSPEHLAEELKALCKEVLKHRQLEERADVRASKRRKLEKSSEASFGDEDLVHTLQGIRIFIMHVKDILDSQAEHPRDVILRQVQDLVGPAGLDLGAQIDVAVSGSIIGTLLSNSYCLWFFVLTRIGRPLILIFSFRGCITSPQLYPYPRFPDPFSTCAIMIFMTIYRQSKCVKRTVVNHH